MRSFKYRALITDRFVYFNDLIS